MENEPAVPEVETHEDIAADVAEHEPLEARLDALETRLAAVEALVADAALMELLEALREVQKEDAPPKSSSWMYRQIRGRRDD